jgi:hypothetical protein
MAARIETKLNKIPRQRSVDAAPRAGFLQPSLRSCSDRGVPSACRDVGRQCICQISQAETEVETPDNQRHIDATEIELAKEQVLCQAKIPVPLVSAPEQR